jgi:hypothetical protein
LKITLGSFRIQVIEFYKVNLKLFLLKGQCRHIFTSGFFHELSSPKPLKKRLFPLKGQFFDQRLSSPSSEAEIELVENVPLNCANDVVLG